MLKILNKKRISRTLRSIRARKFPKCGSTKDLHAIFLSNDELMRSFGCFRDETFYRGMIETKEGYSANIFIIEQLATEIREQPSTELFIDATFNVAPLFTSQLLVITAKINDNVC